MKCDIFLPYYSYNDDKFDMNNYYADSQSYIDALRNYATQDNGMMEVQKKEKDIKYAKCKCTLYNQDNQDMTIDEIVGYYNKNTLIMMILELDLSTQEEEFATELNGWSNEHIQLDNVKNLTEDKRFLVEPKRDVKVVFKNKMNLDTYCTLLNSMMFEKVDDEHYILIVDKVIFTQKF